MPSVPPRLVGDVTRLRQILVNLLSNAVKFTHEGEVCVEVRLGAPRADGAACEVLFAVRDTGIGIPEDRRDRLFRSFSQVDSSTTRQFGGTGLGLAISKRLAELMGGRMWVESEVGHGSTFFFTILAEPAQDASAPVRDERERHLRGTPPPDRRRQRDEPADPGAAGARAGRCEPVAVESGPAALALGRERPDRSTSRSSTCRCRR